tara:strand:+ start:1130 stop:1447 length:318 start_codon:yes stop_codon:yes gene_type:complete
MKSVTLSVSSKDPKFNCKLLSDKLKECGIQSATTENYTITKKNNILYSELGCKSELHEFDYRDLKNKVWLPIKKQFNFDCAHLWVQDKYSGCINDFLYNNGCSKN